MGAVFTPDGKGVISAHDGFLVYIPISGGLTKTIWGNPEGRSGVAVAYSVLLWDLSPDGKTALFYTGGDPSAVSPCACASERMDSRHPGRLGR